MKTMRQIKEDEGRMPTTEEMRDFYNTIATPRESDGWFGSNQHISEGFGRVQFCLKHIEPGMSVLEAGCADGGLSQHIVKAVGIEGHVTLIDISDVFLNRAQEFLYDRSLWCASMTDFEMADACTFSTRRRYDVIVAMEILEHVPDPRRLLANLYGLLRKNSGKIIISVPVNDPDTLGEHLHEFTEQDIAVIVGDATGLHVSTERRGDTIYCVVDKEAAVPYVS